MKRVMLLSVIFLVVLFSASRGMATDCDAVYQQVVDFHSKLYGIIKKTWPVFDFNEETMKLIADGRAIKINVYKKECVEHYSHPDKWFMTNPGVLRLVAGYYNEKLGKKAISDAPGHAYIYMLKKLHPEALVGYADPGSFKVKGNVVNMDAFKEYKDDVKSISFCGVKFSSADEFVISCGDSLEKSFKVKYPSFTLNGSPLSDDDTVEFPDGKKFSIRKVKYFIAAHYLSDEIIAWLEKEMIPRGYLKPPVTQ